MPLIITPGPLQRRAELYHQLGQLTGAGVTLLAALELLEKNPPHRSFRPPIRRLIDGIEAGETFSEALHRAGHWLPSFDVALLHAGEQSGRLPSCFKLLADHYTERARLTRQVLGDLAYPLFILHLAVFIIPFPEFFRTGNLFTYLGKTLGFLAPLYAVVFFFVYALQGRRGETWRSVVEKALHPIPILGKARRDLALSRLAASLEALISAGVTIIEAWEIAALACGSPTLRRTVAVWPPQLQAGKTPSEAVNESRVFPELFANLYHTGEVSGQLDQSLLNLHRLYEEEGTRKLHLFAHWVPRLVYFAILLVIAWNIVSFWMGYFQQVNNAINSVP